MKKNFHIVYGKHAVEAVLQNPRRIVYKLFLSKDLKIDFPLNNIKIEYLSKDLMQKMCRDGDKHQGYIAHVSDLVEDLDLDQYLSMFANKSCILILDQINDPHNVGAILRSAKCFAVDLVIITRYNMPSINASVIRSSVGMSEYMNILTVTNINDSISKLKNNGYWVVGMDVNSESRSLRDVVSQNKKCCFVLGSEGFGLRHGVKNSCDELIQIKMADGAESLNVSNATTIACYEYFTNL